VFVLAENAQGGKTQCLCKMTWSVANLQQQLAYVRSRSTISCGEEIGGLSYAKCLLVLPEPLLLGMGNKFPIGQQLPSRNDRVLKCPFALSNPSTPCSYWQADRILIICRAGEQTAFVCMR